MKKEKEKKKYVYIKFVKIENLKGEAKRVANEKGLGSGLGLVKVYLNPKPVFEVEQVKGDPLNVIKQMALEDLKQRFGIDSVENPQELKQKTLMGSDIKPISKKVLDFLINEGENELDLTDVSKALEIEKRELIDALTFLKKNHFIIPIGNLIFRVSDPGREFLKH